MQRITITSPDAVIAVLPYIVGFRPDDSVVIAWMRDDLLVLAQRLDHPGDTVDRASFMAEVVEPALHSHPDAATIVVTGAPARADVRATAAGSDTDADTDADADVRLDANGRVVPPFATVVDDLRGCLLAAGIDVLDAVYTRDGRWWSYLCDDQCCPPSGRVVDADVERTLRERFAREGIVPLASRLDVAAQVRSDPRAQARIAPLVRAAVAERDALTNEALPAWRAAQLAGPCADILRAPDVDIDDDVLAEVICALGDRDVRDDVVRLLGVQRSLVHVIGVLAAAVRAAPPGHIAPVATCAGIAAWLHGDGVRAVAALERALDEDPTCTLAGMVHVAITHGVPPWEWRDHLAADLAA